MGGGQQQQMQQQRPSMMQHLAQPGLGKMGNSTYHALMQPSQFG